QRKEKSLARITHESAAPAADMGVLRSRTLRRTDQVRLGCEPLRLPGGKPSSWSRDTNPCIIRARLL
ncbi:MAG: hypothetical protein PVG97_03440, partial [Syntrophobacterales bacterium]